jgi:hypothetical protein
MGHESGMRNVQAMTQAMDTFANYLRMKRSGDLQEEQFEYQKDQDRKAELRKDDIARLTAEGLKTVQSGETWEMPPDADTANALVAQQNIINMRRQESELKQDTIDLRNQQIEEDKRNIKEEINKAERLAINGDNDAASRVILEKLWPKLHDGLEFVKFSKEPDKMIVKKIGSGEEIEVKRPSFVDLRSMANTLNVNYADIKRKQDAHIRQFNNSATTNYEKVYSEDGTVAGYRYVFMDPRNGAIRETVKARQGGETILGFDENTGQWIDGPQLETVEYWNSRKTAEGKEVKAEAKKQKDVEAKIEKAMEFTRKIMDEAQTKELSKEKGKINSVKLRQANAKNRETKLPLLKEIKTPEGTYQYVYDVTEYRREIERLFNKKNGAKLVKDYVDSLHSTTKQIIKEEMDAEKLAEEEASEAHLDESLSDIEKNVWRRKREEEGEKKKQENIAKHGSFMND